MDINDNKDIEFVARHYRRGSFDAKAGWRRLGIGNTPLWKRVRVAAAIGAVVIMSASAAFLYHNYKAKPDSRQSEQTQPASPLATVRTIDFENTPLTYVVKEIETVYNVKVGSLPDNPNEYNLSLHYEGTPADLIAVINDILGTHMTVEEI